ncbi:hypothetical protein [Tardiphaga sp.]|uniref:hypothetical protein n=1 Tax=Tardiphaga sp. TaxID=1926292 RepID=UPI00260BE461|nr:hypothetical protein [Tardiphaga sp.]MDB5616572.1 hypothetical protein [Tardiphaga sp.]
MIFLNTRICQVLSLAALTGAFSWQIGLMSEARAVELQGEPPALTLHQTAFASRPSDHRAFTRPDISRSDWVQSGSMATRDANITVVIERRSVARTLRRGILEDLNELSALKSSQVSYRESFHELTTKYGSLRAVVFDVTADGIRKYCTGFHTPGTGKLYVKGFVCSMNQIEASPQVVACTVDKLRFTSDQDEAAAIALVGAVQPKDCGATLLDPNATPPARQPDQATKI